MLTYSVKADPNGRHLVTYLTPGCDVPTVACDCATFNQASAEADRLNDEQRAKETAIKLEHELCGLYRIAGMGAR